MFPVCSRKVTTMNAKQWMMLALAALGVAIVPQTGQTAPATAPEQVVSDKERTPTARDAKMEWFREARFGLFFNFGLYSYYGGIWKGQVRMANRCSEWMMIAARAPVAEYAEAAKVFDPQGFDADEWIRTVREAGARYVVFDAKHHDGFALFRTKASPFNIVDATPFGRDLVAEIADACRKYGVKFGIYYSQNLDWHHPGGGGGGWDPAQKGRMEDYLENVCIPQLRELLTNYGKVDILWYDIPNGVPQAYAERIDRMVRELQPEMIINNRLRHGIPYDIQTPENFVPATGLPGVDWETCLTFNHSWGYSATDHDWKSARDVLHCLCDTASKGGNLLLNLGPDAYGVIPRPCVDRLKVIGAWLGRNGEAIYGTQASPFPFLPDWGRFTLRRGADGHDTLNAIVFDPPASGELLLPGLVSPIRGAWRLGAEGKIPLEIRADDAMGPAIRLDKAAGALQDFVVTIALEGRTKLSETILPAADGSVVLPPRLAKCHGGLRLNEVNIAGLTGSEESLGYWTSPNAGAAWTFRTQRPARYAVELRYGAPAASDGSVIALVFGEQALPFKIRPTGNWTRFAAARVGEIALPAGTHTLSLRLDHLQGEGPCNVGTLRLIPLPEEAQKP